VASVWICGEENSEHCYVVDGNIIIGGINQGKNDECTREFISKIENEKLYSVLFRVQRNEVIGFFEKEKKVKPECKSEVEKFLKKFREIKVSLVENYVNEIYQVYARHIAQHYYEKYKINLDNNTVDILINEEYHLRSDIFLISNALEFADVKNIKEIKIVSLDPKIVPRPGRDEYKDVADEILKTYPRIKLMTPKTALEEFSNPKNMFSQ